MVIFVVIGDVSVAAAAVCAAAGFVFLIRWLIAVCADVTLLSDWLGRIHRRRGLETSCRDFWQYGRIVDMRHNAHVVVCISLERTAAFSHLYIGSPSVEFEAKVNRAGV